VYPQFVALLLVIGGSDVVGIVIEILGEVLLAAQRCFALSQGQSVAPFPLVSSGLACDSRPLSSSVGQGVLLIGLWVASMARCVIMVVQR